jgi:hypothetical protein
MKFNLRVEERGNKLNVQKLEITKKYKMEYIKLKVGKEKCWYTIEQFKDYVGVYNVRIDCTLSKSGYSVQGQSICSKLEKERIQPEVLVIFNRSLPENRSAQTNISIDCYPKN